MIRWLAGLALIAPPLAAQEALRPAIPVIAPLRDQARLRDAWLAKRLDTIVPAAMRRHGIDLWILVARENGEDPVVTTMLDAASFHARRRTILVFFDPGGGKPVERLTVSRYELAGLFAPAWDPAVEPDQWAALAKLVAARNPKRIAVNVSADSAFADGLTKSQHDALVAALSPALRQRIVPAGELAIDWLATRIPEERAAYPGIVRIAHAIIGEAFSDAVIRPGTTTADDVVWWIRERVRALGLAVWFQPSIAIYRRGAAEPLEGGTVIRPGDMLWTDFGILHMGLATDTQHLAYVLRPGERDAPAGLKAGLADANAAQDALVRAFEDTKRPSPSGEGLGWGLSPRVGLDEPRTHHPNLSSKEEGLLIGASGNDLLLAARKTTAARGIAARFYSHPIGTHGHGAGPAIGFWDDQAPGPRGAGPVRGDTFWSIELLATRAVPEWGGQRIDFKLEEDMMFDGRTVTFADGRQDRFHLIGAGK